MRPIRDQYIRIIALIFIVTLSSWNLSCNNSGDSNYRFTYGGDWQQVDIQLELYPIAINGEGKLYQWKENAYSRDVEPERVNNDKDWSKVSAGTHVMALKNNGTLWAWGGNHFGTLGDGTTDDALEPIQIGTDTDWDAIAAGWFHSLALKTDGTLWAWGYNVYGQLGVDANETLVPTPTQIGTDTDWEMISTTGSFSAAKKSDGTIWYWGRTPGEGKVLVPVQIGTDTDWKMITAGRKHLVALKTDGTLWACGGNIYGQLGDGTNEEKDELIQIGTDTDWDIITAGYNHTVALKTDGTLWAWGDNTYRQLGDDTADKKMIPSQIETGTNWLSIAASNRTAVINSYGFMLVLGMTESPFPPVE